MREREQQKLTVTVTLRGTQAEIIRALKALAKAKAA